MKALFWPMLCCIVSIISAQEVHLALDEYKKMREQAQPGTVRDAVALVKVDVAIVIGEETARLTHRITLNVVGDGWQTLTYPSPRIVSTDFGSSRGRLISGNQIQIEGKGRHQITLETVHPLLKDEREVRPERSLHWKTPSAPVVVGTLKTPGFEGSILTDRLFLKEQTGTFVAMPGQTVILRLSPQSKPKIDNRPLKLEVVSTTVIQARINQIWVLARIEGKLIQGSVRELNIPMPEGFDLVDLDGPAHLDWAVNDNLLTIKPLKPITWDFDLDLELTRLPLETLTPPFLIPREAEKSTLFTGAWLEGEGILELTHQGSSSSAFGDNRFPDELKSMVWSALLSESDDPPRWQVVRPSNEPLPGGVAREQGVTARIDRMVVEVQAGRHGMASYRCWLSLRNTGSMNLRITPPPGFRLVAANVGGMQPGSDGTNLVFPLRADPHQEQLITMVGLLPLDLPRSGEVRVPLPEFSIPVAKSEVLMGLPGDRSWQLTDPRRMGLVEKAPDGADYQDLPPGYRKLEAGWNTLSKKPEHLRITARAY